MPMPASRPAFWEGSRKPNSYVVEVNPGVHCFASASSARRAGTAAYVMVRGQAWPGSIAVHATYPAARRRCAPGTSLVHGWAPSPALVARSISQCHYGWNFTTSTRLPNRSIRSEEHTSELQSRGHVVCILLLEII